MKTVLLLLLTLFIFISVLCAGVTAFMFKTAIARKGTVENPWTKEENFTEDTPRFSSYDGAFEKGREWLRRAIIDTNSEEVVIVSFDNLRLRGRIFHHPNPRGIILLCHGYRSNPIRDFGTQAKTLYDEGFSLLAIDQRAHGGSEGEYISYGVNERYDVRDWCSFIEKKYPELPVALYGVSMGASSVMMAAGLDDLPANVRAAIADCGFTTPAAICKRVMKKRFRVPVFPVYYMNALTTRLLAGFSLSAGDSRQALRKTKLPFLIVHGRADKFVPFYMGEENHAAAPESDFFAPEGAGHCCAFIGAPEEYTEAMDRLFEKAGI